MKEKLPLFQQFWRPITIGTLLAIATFLLLFFHLGSRPADLSSPEESTRVASSSLHKIYDNPINAPLTLPEHLLTKIRPRGIAASRGMSAVYAVITLVLLFAVLRFWQGSLTATLGTLLLGTSSWFLHTARLDTPDILMFGIVPLFAVTLWLKHTLRRNLITLTCAITGGIALYVPGLIWFIAIGAVCYHRAILRELKHTKIVTKILSCLIFIALAAPLGWAIAKEPSLVFSALGLPRHLPNISQLGRNLSNIPVQLFWRGPMDPVRWLGNQPVLDFFADAMLALGLYSYWEYRKLYRTKLIFGSLLIGIVLITVGGGVTLTILIPIIYIIIAAGVLYMLDAWYKVFPRNPIARSTGLSLLTIAIALSCIFQLRSYFVAWQSSPATKAVFSEPAINLVGKPLK